MSICSGINITRKKAEKILKNMLLFDQEILIDLAIKSMDNLDLASKISDECYDYNIYEEFEVGDIVKIKEGTRFHCIKMVFCEGKIINIRTKQREDHLNIVVQWDNGSKNDYDESDLELV